MLDVKLSNKSQSTADDTNYFCNWSFFQLVNCWRYDPHSWTAIKAAYTEKDPEKTNLGFVRIWTRASQIFNWALQPFKVWSHCWSLFFRFVFCNLFISAPLRVLNNIIRIIHSVSDCTTGGIIPSLFLIFIILLLYIKQTAYCEYESDLRSNEHYLSSRENKAWKKFRPVQDLNLWPLRYRRSKNCLLLSIVVQ